MKRSGPLRHTAIDEAPVNRAVFNQDEIPSRAEPAGMCTSTYLVGFVAFFGYRGLRAKVYALHAPEVECIGKGKVRAPYEFRLHEPLATPSTRPRGGRFVLHAHALHGKLFLGHALGPMVADMEKLSGVEAKRSHVKGYRGHRYQPFSGLDLGPDQRYQQHPT